MWLNEITFHCLNLFWEYIMSAKPEYSGLDKYPGWVATGITIVIGAVFLGALFMGGGDHGDHGDHGNNAGDHSSEGKAH